jgi:hypothetical protein
MASIAQTARRAYEVERIESHTLVEQVAQFEDTGEKDKRGRPINRFIGFKKQKREVKDGYMVYFPRGHSIYVENEDALKRLNFDVEGGLVDMATGLPVPPDAIEPPSLKEVVARATQSRGGVDNVIEELE